MYIWLSNLLGTSASHITISFAFFIIIIVAVATVILFSRRFNTENSRNNIKKHPSRLTLCETIAIDRTRRLILVRCDDKEHLLLIGGLTDVVVESNVINARVTQQHTQPVLTTTETNLNLNLTGKRSFSVNGRENTQRRTSTPFIKQKVEDSITSAEIEGRQEPFLFIPAFKK
ncbi:hypothetical protein ABID39_000577 [Bartonella japonica]|uniref:Flagellar biosynthesis protein FliO n=1 Tax=Bartonella japonica TaxID=357761 RepID=A0ABV2FN40_9HYPH